MKKILLSTIATASLIIPCALAEDLTVFRVCEDQHVLRTSDGEEAGRVEYIVVEPSSQRVVSAVVTGGVVSSRHVAIPMSAIQVGSGREVTLTSITRERLLSAPTIETSRFSSSSVIEPAVVERTYSYFGMDPAEITRTSTSTNTTLSSPSTATTTDRSATMTEGAGTAASARTNTGTPAATAAQEPSSAASRDTARTRARHAGASAGASPGAMGAAASPAESSAAEAASSPASHGRHASRAEAHASAAPSAGTASEAMHGGKSNVTGETKENSAAHRGASGESAASPASEAKPHGDSSKASDHGDKSAASARAKEAGWAASEMMQPGGMKHSGDASNPASEEGSGKHGESGKASSSKASRSGESSPTEAGSQ